MRYAGHSENLGGYRMQMTPEEICRSYREAKDPNKQIKILADLNSCEYRDIVETLEANNEPFKKRPYCAPEKPGKKSERKPEKSREGTNIPKQPNPPKLPADKIKTAKLPEAVLDAISRRISELDQIIEVIKSSLEKNEKTREELQEFLWIHTKKD